MIQRETSNSNEMFSLRSRCKFRVYEPRISHKGALQNEEDQGELARVRHQVYWALSTKEHTTHQATKEHSGEIVELIDNVLLLRSIIASSKMQTRSRLEVLLRSVDPRVPGKGYSVVPALCLS